MFEAVEIMLSSKKDRKKFPYQIHNIDNRDIALVFGYVRKQVKKFQIKSVWPHVLNYRIIMFAFIFKEKFKFNKYSKSIWNGRVRVYHYGTKLSFDAGAPDKPQWVTIRGNKKINLGNFRSKYTWILKLNFVHAVSCLVGISNIKESELENELANQPFATMSRVTDYSLSDWAEDYFYAIGDDGMKYRKEGNDYIDQRRYRDKDIFNGENRVKIKMILDCTKSKQKKIQYYVNDVHEFYANFNAVKVYNNAKKMDNVYTLCISLKLCCATGLRLHRFIEG